MRIRSLPTLVCLIAVLGVAWPAAAQYGASRLSNRATGENYHVEAGIFFWNPTPDIVIASEALGQVGDKIDFVVRANAFLHHMVRNVIGTLVYVGKGKHPPAWVKDLLASKERSKAAPTFGPEGLYLEKVEYESRWGLPQ